MTRPVTIEDVLSTEFIGRAEFSPDGRWLAYNLLPSYASLSDYSYWMRAGGLSGHQLWLKDLAGQASPRLQPGLDPDATNFLFGLSPDSRWVVVIEHKMGRLRLVACPIGKPACVRFDPMPDIRDRYAAALQWNERLVWTSDDTFVMPTRRADLPGSEMRSRAATGVFLWDAWNRAWSGQTSTSSEVLSTARDRTTDWSEGELTRFDLSTGKAERLAPGRFVGVLASPDRKQLLAARVAERARPASDAKPVARETHPIFDRRYAFRLIESATGNVRDLETPFQIDPGSVTWRSDSKAFAVFGWNSDEPPEDGRFYTFDMDRLEAHPFERDTFRLTGSIDDPAFKWWPGPARAVLFQEGLVVHGRSSPDARPGWFLLGTEGTTVRLSGALPMPKAELIAEGTDGIFVFSEGAAYALDPGSPPERIDVPGAAHVRSLEYRPYAEHGWSGESFPMSRLTRQSLTAEFVLVAQDSLRNDLAVLFSAPGLEARQPLKMDVSESGARVLAASPRIGAVLATLKDGAATRLMLLRNGRNGETLTVINSHLNRVLHPGTKEISYTLRDPEGIAPLRRVAACLLLPPGFDASRKYPVLVEVYPAGTGGGCRTLADAPNAGPIVGDLWAARDFIYVRPPFPLDLAEAPGDPLGRLGSLLDQTVDALGALGFADTDRVVVYGFSQGGTASLVAAVQSDRPAAIISMQGWADYFSHYFGARGMMRYFHLDQNGGDNRWRYECEGDGPVNSCPFGFGGSALAEPEAFARTSPVARAAEVSAPVLLVHSDFDYFDMAQYDEMFGALYRAGKEARYVRYWGEGHGPSSPANIRDLWIRIDDFLTEHMDLDPE